MWRDAVNNTDLYRKYRYFDNEFPFDIWRETSSAKDFNENHRYRREFWKIILILKGEGEKLINQ